MTLNRQLQIGRVAMQVAIVSLWVGIVLVGFILSVGISSEMMVK